MQVKDVFVHVIMRLNFVGVEYQVYNAKTGSTYIRCGKDRLRIADHAGKYDDYTMVIRTDCAEPVKLTGITVVPAEKTDIIVDMLIQRNKCYLKEKETLERVLEDGTFTHRQIKSISAEYIYQVAGIPQSNGVTMKKEDIVKGLIDGSLTYHGKSW